MLQASRSESEVSALSLTMGLELGMRTRGRTEMTTGGTILCARVNCAERVPLAGEVDIGIVFLHGLPMSACAGHGHSCLPPCRATMWPCTFHKYLTQSMYYCLYCL